MADSSNITASPFLRAEIVDRVLQLTNPAIPYLSAIYLSPPLPTGSTASPSTPAWASVSLYQLILRHCRALGIKERKQRYELLTAKLHLLVNASAPPASHANAKADRDGDGDGDGATNGYEAQMQKAVGELDVLLLRLEIAVLALLQAGGGADADAHAISGPAEAGELVQAQAQQQATEQATEGMIGAGGKWKEAESVAGLVNTECGHLIRRLDRLATATATASPAHERIAKYDAHRVIEMEDGDGDERAAKGCLSDSSTQHTTAIAESKRVLLTRRPIDSGIDVSPAQAQKLRPIGTAVHIRLAALDVLVRVDEQFGRDGRVKRWQEQIAKLQDQLTT